MDNSQLKSYNSAWSSNSLNKILLYLMLYVPSIRPLAKYLPEQLLLIGIGLYLLGALVGIYLITKKWDMISNFLNRMSVFAILVIALIIVNLVIYPRADALKTELRGSDQDDNLIIVGEGILRGESAYHLKTYLGNPISPGPGWALISLPFVAFHLYALFTPASLLLGGLIIKRYSGEYAKANLFLLFWMSSLIFWEISVVGSDMVALGIFFVVAILLSHRIILKTSLEFYLVAILTGLLITSRINFFYLGILLGVFIGKQNIRQGILFGVISTATGFLLHGLFMLMTDGFYSPLHLILLPKPFINSTVLIIGVILCAITGVLTLIYLKPTILSWLFWGWICILMPALIMSLAELFFLKFDFAIWEGANYLFVASPIYLVGYILSAPQIHQNKPVSL